MHLKRFVLYKCLLLKSAHAFIMGFGSMHSQRW